MRWHGKKRWYLWDVVDLSSWWRQNEAVNWGSLALWLMIKGLHWKWPQQCSSPALERASRANVISSPLPKVSHNGCSLESSPRCLISNCEPTEEKVRWLFNNAFCLLPDLMRMHNSKECFVNTYNAFRLPPWSAIQSKTLALRESLATYTHSLRVGPVLASETV